MSFQLLQGDCVDQLRGLDDASVDAVVCDPPYGLSREPDVAEVLTHWLAGDDYEHRGGGFMGKSWDSFVPGPAVWREAFRVLKPGGHLLAFAGSRTSDLMGISIRLAGFEIRDSIMWLYGSGFPKSLDVSKAIDKANGKHDRDLTPFGAYVQEARVRKGWTLKRLDQAMGTNTSASWWEGRKAGVQPPSVEMYGRLKGLLDLDDRYDDLVAWAEAEREIVGRASGAATQNTESLGAFAAEYDATLPATADAQRWDGWGTALKPAHEPIVVARKPLVGTVSQNVLTHGTGAINVDGCRIGTDGGTAGAPMGNTPSIALTGGAEGRLNGDAPGALVPGLGRWPANVVLDPEAGVELDEQSGNRPSSGGRVSDSGMFAMKAQPTVDTGYGDSGGASRFFYCAKTSRGERNAGLDGFATAPLNWSSGEESPGTFQGDGTDREARNHHPTVKPINLMRWLVRLVTPPGGTVLDPFAGSGSTGCAAVLEGFDFIGCEREAEYVAIAEARIAFWAEHSGREVADVLKADAALRRAEAKRSAEGQGDLLAEVAA